MPCLEGEEHGGLGGEPAELAVNGLLVARLARLQLACVQAAPGGKEFYERLRKQISGGDQPEAIHYLERFQEAAYNHGHRRVANVTGS